MTVTTTDDTLHRLHAWAGRSPVRTVVVATVAAAVLVGLGGPSGAPPYPLGVLPLFLAIYALGPRVAPLLAAFLVVLTQVLAPVVGYPEHLVLGVRGATVLAVVVMLAGAFVGRWGETERRLRAELRSRDDLERRLLRREASLSQVLANLPAVLWVTDRDLRVTFAQGRGFTDHGVEVSDVVGRPLEQTLVGYEPLIDAHRAALAGETPPPVEVSVEGRVFEAHVVAQSHAAQVESVIGVAIDVTERAQAQSALEANLERERELSTQLRHVDDMKNGFLQAVSHELRTPLTALSGFTATLRRSEDRLSAAQRALVLERIHRNADKLDRLLSDLLDVDRLSRGVVGPQRTHTDIGASVLRLLDETDFGAHPLHTAIESTRAFVDAPKVERIVENLLHNAMRHTPPTTPITVRVRRVDDAVLIQVEQEEVAVADELKERIFQPFAQGPVARWSATPGTGIGLALVTQFAALHGGRAWVEDRAGGGAIFSVRLPDEDVPEGVEVHAGPSSGDGRRTDQDTPSPNGSSPVPPVPPAPPEGAASGDVPLRR